MTRITRNLTLLTGGLCSLALASGAGAAPTARVLTVCEEHTVKTVVIQPDADRALIRKLNEGARHGAPAGDAVFTVRGADTPHQGKAFHLAMAAQDGAPPAARPPQPPKPPQPPVMIGVTLGGVSGVDAEGVVMIERVIEGMPAEQSGLRRFDIITSVNGESPVTTPMIQRLITTKKAGDEVRVRVLRAGDPYTFTVKLAKAPGENIQRVVVAPGELRELRLAEREARGIQQREREEVERELKIELNKMRERQDLQRESIRRHQERLGLDVESLMDKLAEIEIGLEGEQLEEFKRAMAELTEKLQGSSFTFTMPNIEFLPGNGEEAVVIIEGDPEERGMFRFRSGDAQGGMGWESDKKPGEGRALDSDRNRELESRLDSMEQRMDRIEKLLEHLADRID